MPKPTEPLTPAQVYRFAVAFCQPRLAFRSVGKVTSEVLVTASSPPRGASPPRTKPLRGGLKAEDRGFSRLSRSAPAVSLIQPLSFHIPGLPVPHSPGPERFAPITKVVDLLLFLSRLP